MKVFRMADVEKIEQMLAEGKTVVVEWHTHTKMTTRLRL